MSTSVRTLVEPTADILRIVSLRRGDVYKRLDETYSGKKMSVGIVTDVLNNGQKVAVTAIEYTDSFSGLNANIRVFSDNDDAATLFPAKPGEVSTRLHEIRTAAQSHLRDAERTVVKARDAMTVLDDLIQETATKPLTSPKVERQSIGGPNRVAEATS